MIKVILKFVTDEVLLNDQSDHILIFQMRVML